MENNQDRNSCLIWMPGKKGTTKDGREYELFNGVCHIEGKDYDMSGFLNTSKSGTKQYIKLYEKEQKIKTEEVKKEF